MQNEKKINSLIGRRIVLIRKQKKIARSKLALSLKISHQQLNKYETGENRISASKLSVLCSELNVSPLFFYFGLDLIGDESLNENMKNDLNTLFSYFIKINKKSRREAIINIVKELI